MFFIIFSFYYNLYKPKIITKGNVSIPSEYVNHKYKAILITVCLSEQSNQTLISDYNPKNFTRS